MINSGACFVAITIKQHVPWSVMIRRKMGIWVRTEEREKKNKKKDIREKKKPETQWASIYKSNCPSKNCTFNQTLSTLSLYLSFPLFFYIFPLLHRLNICQPKLFNRFNECLSFYFGRSLNKQFTKENNFFFLFLFID